MALLQDFIHRLEVAAGKFRYVPAILALALVALCYDLRDYRNFSNAEAMDAAQLGHRIAQGKGFTTQFVRPLELFLLQRQEQSVSPSAADLGKSARPGLQSVPDVSNPPVYPLVLAVLMKVLPFNFTASAKQHFFSIGGHFLRYQPDFIIAIANECLFVVLIGLVFYWARRLFDPAVGWTAALLLIGSEPLWRFSVSGLSTMLLLVLFMGLVWCLTLLESELREPRKSMAFLIGLGAATGLLVALGGLTRYSFGWLIIPAVVVLLLSGSPRRGILALVMLLAFFALFTPWLIRNYHICGAPFGTDSYHVLEGTSIFPGNRLERSLAPNLHFFTGPIWAKLFSNLPQVFSEAYSYLGGGLIGAFFLVGILVGFRSAAIRQMRYFLLMALAVFIVVQALGRTQLSEDSPGINSENLLVLAGPLVIVYGVSLFFTLLDRINFPTPSLRSFSVGLFVLLGCVPLVFALCSRVVPLAYPPYHPMLIQQTSAWLKPEELSMSDIPWAVAWYGDRPCVWTTLNATADPDNPGSKENFFSINDYYWPIHALYLTQKTTDSRFVSDWIQSGEFSWGSFIVDTILKKEVPQNFPLHQMPTGYLPEQLFLSDWKRWR